MSKKITSIIFIVVLVCLSLYDLVLFSIGLPTISSIVWEWNAKMPVIPFLGGFVAGHLWWK